LKGIGADEGDGKRIEKGETEVRIQDPDSEDQLLNGENARDDFDITGLDGGGASR
jgi:hypothetical protein